MKLSFTTLGCPKWDLDQIISRAAEYGFDGIDFRGIREQMEIYRLPEFAEHAQKTRRKIEQAGLKVSCFSSSVYLFSTEKREQHVHEIEQYARLCETFGTPYIRVFGGKIGQTDRKQAVDIVVQHARKLAQIAKRHGAKLLLETHDDWTAANDVKAVTDAVGPEELAVLWDVHHPYRTLGEKPQETWAVLGDRIEYTHWKDSRLNPKREKGFEYCLMGEGDVPLHEIYEVLVQNGYEGWFTFEWEKRWHPELEEPEIAFPQYVRFMCDLRDHLTALNNI